MSHTFGGLPYLTKNDCSLLADRAKRVSIKSGETLIQRGKETRMVYLLLHGRVRIEGSQGTIAHIGGGQVVGEMAFLEDSLPSASAIAEEAVEAYALTWESLSDLFEIFPHLASRFYRSLALNLSQRLRDLLTPKKVVASGRGQ